MLKYCCFSADLDKFMNSNSEQFSIAFELLSEASFVLSNCVNNEDLSLFSSWTRAGGDCRHTR